MATVTGRVEMCCTIERDVGGVMHPIFYVRFNGVLEGAQPSGCTPELFGVDLVNPIGKALRDHILYADSRGWPCAVAGAGELTPGHPSERISNVYTEL